MSIHQGLVSPPLSGTTHKADKPRIGDVYPSASAAAHIFGAHATNTTQHTQHSITSPVKKHAHHLSDAERAARPLTPPMSKDVRHDDHDDPKHHRATSEGDNFVPPSSSSTSSTFSSSYVAGTTHHEGHVTQPMAPVVAAAAAAAAAENALWPAATITSRFGTLNQAIAGFESDDEHNPFLDRHPPAASSSSSSSLAAPAHHSHAYFDEYDSEQDAPGSVDEYSSATPRATTPRARFSYVRLARPLCARISADSEPVTAVAPIRDTPNNPFLAGGPADHGFQGPHAHAAHRRVRHIPAKESGKITYVFRGQRVTYADPEYDSDDDDDDDNDQDHEDREYRRTNEFNPHHQPKTRPPRLQPRLLFPPTSRSNTPVRVGENSKTSASRSDEGAVAVKRKYEAAPVTATEAVESGTRRHRAVAPGSSCKLQSVITRDTQTTTTTARDALLARLDQTNWSDDDDDEQDERDGREATDDEVEVESQIVPRQTKRLSDELHAGHENQLDEIGRPLKRWRASYAF